MVKTNINKAQAQIDTLWSGFLVVMVALMSCMLPIESMAQLAGTDSTLITGSGTSLDNALCNVISWFNGPIGKGIATVCLIIVGVGALMGKVSWGMAIIVGIGVAIIFGASELVSAIGGAGQQNCGDGVMSGNTI